MFPSVLDCLGRLFVSFDLCGEYLVVGETCVDGMAPVVNFGYRVGALLDHTLASQGPAGWTSCSLDLGILSSVSLALSHLWFTSGGAPGSPSRISGPR
jgi:hypothetical protein